MDSVTFIVLVILTVASTWAAPSPLELELDDEFIIEDEAHEIHREGRAKATTGEDDPEFWLHKAQDELVQKLKKSVLITKAKNVILFLGDGMSISTVTAARIYLGQQEGRPGEETQLSFEKFPYTGLSKTYCVDSQVADSACSATAYLGGVKANIGTIGVTARVKKNDCHAMKNTSNQVSSILQWSQDAGKSTGIVTTTRVTHASPAGTYAHVANRDWESPADVAKKGLDPHICPSIAQQLVKNYPGKDIKVILGGGRTKFKRSNSTAEDLIRTWERDKSSRGATYKYMKRRTELNNADLKNTDYLLGLFSGDHMKYHLQTDPEKYPSLEEMTRAAIQVLKKNEKGFFLFVEGGRIDHAHHSTKAHLALDETVEFAKAVQAAVNVTKESETLIVVTSDHGHTLTFSGYPSRGNNIFGVAGTASDKLPYATLSYANGAGYKATRHNISQDNMADPNYLFPATVLLSTETHDGSDVGIFARGPLSHLFTGVVEQNVIPHILAYASCVGNKLTYCSQNELSES